MAAYKAFFVVVMVASRALTGAEGMPVLHRGKVNINLSGMSEQLLVSRIQNRSFVRTGITPSFEGFLSFSMPNNPFIRMFGLQKNGTMFFMEPINNRLRIIQNNLSVSNNDNRLFELKFFPQSGARVIKHVATGTFVKVGRTGKAMTTNDIELASSFLIVHT